MLAFKTLATNTHYLINFWNAESKILPLQSGATHGECPLVSFPPATTANCWHDNGKVGSCCSIPQ